MAKQPCTYILATRRHGTIYIGVTASLVHRLYQHREGTAESFTKRYAIHRLVHYEFFADMPTAIAHEKQLKRWRRD